ncbi:MAG: hypothetical protein AVDCRST_MAG75-2805 [uncultured Propionibacteriaceae bacterium]|uniref:Uncharacterized protein n=1 Tax=uncultured Propionibacteriaceae bacterium TaxID=257457 RepID=A0A6N3ITV9_9ACTN|nr:MAG: hypothetical protein AVDCRST_MAG75-2805 [uncultured Propionibacteriaceae bacterium]
MSALIETEDKPSAHVDGDVPEALPGSGQRFRHLHHRSVPFMGVAVRSPQR